MAMAMAMATPPPTLLLLHPPLSTTATSPFFFFHASLPPRPSLPLPSLSTRRRHRLRAVVDGQAVVDAAALSSSDGHLTDQSDAGESPEPKARPCELYVCNLPRSSDIARLHEMFKPYGTVQSVEVSRSAETGVSKGCGYVTMSSIAEAKAAISALDGTDLDGREVRVRYSADLFSRKRNPDALNTAPKNIVVEGPYKAYVGNLPWSVKPEDLRAHFGRFGTLVSARLLYDRRKGKNRVYGFISYSTPGELDSALSSNGEDFFGRVMVVRKIGKKSES